jgi:hypothetical protein
MKIKNAWITLAVALLIVLPTRIYQVLFLVEPGTGFYTDGNTTTLIISAGLIVGILAIMGFAFMEKEKRVYRPIHSLPTAVIGTLMGLGLIFNYLISLFGVQEQQNSVTNVIVSIFGVLAGAVLILTAYNFATAQNTFNKHPLLSLIPSLWGCVSLVTLFITYVSVVNIAENIYDTFTVIFLLLFLFSQAKMLAGIENEKSIKRIFMFGIPTVLMALVTGIPSAILVFSGTSRTSAFPVGLHLVNILTAFYVIAFLSAVSRLPLATENQSAEEGAEHREKPPIEVENFSDTPDVEQSERKCIEYLRGAYQSQEKFIQRERSPFQ